MIKAWESYNKTQSKTASGVYPSNIASSADKKKIVKFSHFKIDPVIILMG